MCQTSGPGMQSDQIRKFIEHGMPEKIVKTVQYTIRKREAAQNSPNTNMDTHNINDVNALNPLPTEQMKPLSIPRLCGRFRNQATESGASLQDKITNIGAAGSEDIQNSKPQGDMDALAITTEMTKHFVQRMCDIVEKMQNSKLYTLLTRTTQPAHIVAVCVLTFVTFTVWPDIVDTRNVSNNRASHQVSPMGDRRSERHNTLATIAYLGAFATHFGAQIWMTFISGLSLYFSLPRHIFGQCQQILFPRYFAMSSILSISMLILFVKYFLTSWNATAITQLIALSATVLIEIIIRLYLAPPMLRLMHEKYRIEGAIGSGREVGSLEQGILIQCPHYQRIHTTFRRIHMTIAMGNMSVLLATCLHLYFLASKIQIS
uniref:Transmembrane protein 205 n=1 Tax=Bactrocera latifrons TaxID=174628 RepID=A0A0K8VLG5_BACLA